jgi:hypothetical protein
MVADYDAVLARAAALPLPAPTLPPSLRVQASEHLATLVAPFGDLSCELF